MILGDILQNSISINELNERENTDGAYVLMGIGVDNERNYYPTRIIINNYELESVEPLSVLYAVNAKKSRSGHPAEFTKKNGFSNSSFSNITIADFLDIVKDNFADTLSQDVLNNYGIERPKSSLSESVKYSIKENQNDNTDINEIINSDRTPEEKRVANVHIEQAGGGVTKYADEEAAKISKIGPTYSNYVLDKDMSLRAFFEKNTRKKNNIYEKLYMGKISDNLSERIDSILRENGIDESVKGEHFIITNDFVEHTKRRHSIGSNETAEQITGDNIDVLRDVINQPDEVSFGGLNENKKPVIVFKKNIDGANAVYVQFSSLKRNGLIGKTLYFDSKIKK